MPRKITPGLSLYMDLLRFLAAVSVALSHLWPTLSPHHNIPWPGHDAVMVFFVISGLVIAHASEGRPFSVYFEHRTLRIYSVALPALVLSILIASVLPADFHVFGSSLVPHPERNFVVNLFFLGQLWGLSVPPAADSPYWSLNYEVWYYVIFAAAIYAPARWRVLAIAAAAVIAGPKILLLMPVWLFGVALYRLQPRMSEGVALALFVGSVIAALLYMRLGVAPRLMAWSDQTAPWVMSVLYASRNFIGDSILGLIVAVNFAAAANLAILERVLRGWRQQIRTASSFTFSIYLYHVPTFALLWWVVGLRSWLVLPVLAVLLAALGQCTERQLPRLRRMVEGRARVAGASA